MSHNQKRACSRYLYPLAFETIVSLIFRRLLHLGTPLHAYPHRSYSPHIHPIPSTMVKSCQQREHQLSLMSLSLSVMNMLVCKLKYATCFLGYLMIELSSLKYGLFVNRRDNSSYSYHLTYLKFATNQGQLDNASTRSQHQPSQMGILCSNERHLRHRSRLTNNRANKVLLNTLHHPGNRQRFSPLAVYLCGNVIDSPNQLHQPRQLPILANPIAS
mmetsp:Transcript_13569/g.20162  ORF Transcript_13569/g.20162 Transcript_13569/m.20162 type:complete len:216 (-) Transcript_13569:608-1255(-)